MDNTLTEGISLNRGLPFFCCVQVNYKCTTKQTNNDTKSSIFVSLMIHYGKQ